MVPTISTSNRRKGVLAIVGCALFLALGAVSFGLWATADRKWEQTWKERVRVETPLGEDKDYVMAWINRNCDSHPFVDSVCEDTLNDIPVVALAGVDSEHVASFVRVTVVRDDLLASSAENMRIYYFFDAKGKVVDHYYLPFHELAQFERSHQFLASSAVTAL
jgi:hypothetical protein